MNFSDQRTTYSISPFQKDLSHNNKVSKFNKNTDQSDILKSELRQAFIAEEEYRYQVEMLKKQNDELQKQLLEQQRQYQKLDLEFSKISSQFELTNEKYATLEIYTKQLVALKEIVIQQKRKNSALAEQLLIEKRSNLDIFAKHQKLSEECLKLDQQNKDLTHLNESMQIQKNQLQKLVDTQQLYEDQKDSEYQMLQAKFNRLQSFYRDKEQEIQAYFERNESQNQDQVEKFKQQFEIMNNQMDLLNNIVLSQEQELIENKEFSEKQYEEYQQLQQEYEELVGQIDNFKQENVRLSGDNDQMKKNFDKLQSQLDELENLKQNLKVELEQERSNNEELQINVVSLQNLAYQYKSQFDQLYNERQSKRLEDLIQLSAPTTFESRTNKATSQLKKIINYSSQEETVKNFNLPQQSFDYRAGDKMHQISYEMSKISPKSQQQLKGFHSFNFSEKNTCREQCSDSINFVTPESTTIRDTVLRQQTTSQFENKENVNQNRNTLFQLQKKYLTLRNRIGQN